MGILIYSCHFSLIFLIFKKTDTFLLLFTCGIFFLQKIHKKCAIVLTFDCTACNPIENINKITAICQILLRKLVRSILLRSIVGIVCFYKSFFCSFYISFANLGFFMFRSQMYTSRKKSSKTK